MIHTVTDTATWLEGNAAPTDDPRSNTDRTSPGNR